MVLYARKSIGNDMAPGGFVTVNGLDQSFKRVTGIAAAAAILLCFTPILLITAVAIKLGSRGPIFVRERRGEYEDGAVQVFRFRLTSACVEGGDRTNLPLTRVGRILNRTGVDELPQLLNVLRGEISFTKVLDAARGGSAFI